MTVAARPSAPNIGNQPKASINSDNGDAAADLFARKKNSRYWLVTLALRLLILVLAIGLWEVLGRYTDWDKWITKPSSVWEKLLIWERDGVLWSSIKATLSAALIGFVLGAAVGALGGFVLGSMKRVGNLLEPFVLAAYSIPKIALAPLFVLWFGIDLLPKIMMAALLVGFLVFFSVYQGCKTIDQQLIAICRLMGANRLQILRKVTIPYCSAWMFTGLKMGLPYALIGAVVGEFMAATSGVGYLIKNASGLFDTDGVFAGLVVLMAISTILSSLLAMAEKRVLHWAGKGI
jgi:NitT/TauT family transport system permease protein